MHDSDIWIDWRGERKANLDNLGRVVESLKTKDKNSYYTTAESAAFIFKDPSYNGEAIYFNSICALRILSQTGGLVREMNNFHNGSPWTTYLTFKYFSQSQSTTGRNIVSTAGATITNSSIGMRIDNLNSVADPHTIRVKIFNGTGGTPGIYDVQGPDNCLVDGEYNELKIVFTGAVLSVYLRNSANPRFTLIGTDAVGSGLVTTDSTSTYCVGVEGFGFSGYIKQIITWWRVLTPDEETIVETFLASDTANVIIPEPVDVHFGWGQSNDDPGSGTVNSTMPTDFPELTGLQNGFIYSALNSNYDNKVNYWNQMIMDRNVSSPNTHNWMLRMCHEFADVGHPIYLINAGRGATGLLDQVASVDWYADGGSATVGDMYPNWKLMVAAGLEELVHVLRKTPVLKSIGQFQGENDTSDPLATSPAYRLALENWIKSALTYLGSLGYSTANIHYYLFRTINSGINGPDVRADQAYVMANFKADFPAYSIADLHLIDTDGFDYAGNHVTNLGASQAGQAAADLLIPFI